MKSSSLPSVEFGSNKFLLHPFEKLSSALIRFGFIFAQMSSNLLVQLGILPQQLLDSVLPHQIRRPVIKLTKRA